MSRQHKWACFVVSSVAGLLLVWSIAIFWFRNSGLTQAALVSNAVALIVIWAIGPAVWFAIEWRLWRAEPGLAIGQQYARDFWLGTGAIVIILATREIGNPTPASVIEYTIAWNLVVEVIRIIVWPAIVVAGFVLFREPMTLFLQALGSRASKVGIFSVSVELSALPEAHAWSGPRLDDLRTEFPAAASDSSGSILKAVADTSSADYMTVNLGSGQNWLTSRLFILAALIPRVRPIKRIVFLIDPADSFVGHASTTAVAEGLARRYRWLDEAYAAALKNVNAPVIGPLESQQASQVLMQYLSAVKGAGTTPDWVNVGTYQEHATWVTSTLLEHDLDKALDVSAVKRDPAADAVSLGKTLLRHGSPYVAVLDSSGRFLHLIDRIMALDQVVRRELA